MPKKLTYSQKRRKQFETKRHKEVEKQLNAMTNKELREENNKELTDPETINRSKAIQTGKFVSEALKVYIAGDEERFNKYSDRLKILVKTIYKNSVDGNNSTVQEMLNRVEGKVKDEVIIENKIAQHIPDQNKSKAIRDKYKVLEKSDKDDKTVN